MSTDPAASLPITPGDVIADKYRVERVLGRGGMGVVVAAMHLHLDQGRSVTTPRPSSGSFARLAPRFG